MLKLIADSGSTKTDWVLINDRGETLAFCKSHGLNPYHLSDEEILETLRDCVKKDITRQYESFPINIESLAIYFYGSGVTGRRFLSWHPCCAKSSMLMRCWLLVTCSGLLVPFLVIRKVSL